MVYRIKGADSRPEVKEKAKIRIIQNDEELKIFRILKNEERVFSLKPIKQEEIMDKLRKSKRPFILMKYEGEYYYYMFITKATKDIVDIKTDLIDHKCSNCNNANPSCCQKMIDLFSKGRTDVTLEDSKRLEKYPFISQGCEVGNLSSGEDECFIVFKCRKHKHESMVKKETMPISSTFYREVLI